MRKPINHQDLLSKVEDLIDRASSDPIGRWTGFARVLECLIQYAEHSTNNPKVRSMAPPLLNALLGVEARGAFQAIDVHDHRTDQQLRKDILHHG